MKTKQEIRQSIIDEYMKPLNDNRLTPEERNDEIKYSFNELLDEISDYSYDVRELNIQIKELESNNIELQDTVDGLENNANDFIQPPSNGWDVEKMEILKRLNYNLSIFQLQELENELKGKVKYVELF